MFSFKSVYFVIFTLVLCTTRAEISDKRLCIDEKCSELIAVGKTLIRFPSPEEHVLSFVPNEEVKIYSYGAGKREELIGVEINGKRGYVNKHHVRETRLIKRATLLVDTELAKTKPQVPLDSTTATIQADPTREAFEVVDGTKIPLDLASLTTEAPVLNEKNPVENTKPLESVPDTPKVNPTEHSGVKVKDVQSEKLDEHQDEEDEDDDEEEQDNEEEDDEDEDQSISNEADTNQKLETTSASAVGSISEASKERETENAKNIPLKEGKLETTLKENVPILSNQNDASTVKIDESEKVTLEPEIKNIELNKVSSNILDSKVKDSDQANLLPGVPPIPPVPVAGLDKSENKIPEPIVDMATGVPSDTLNTNANDAQDSVIPPGLTPVPISSIAENQVNSEGKSSENSKTNEMPLNELSNISAQIPIVDNNIPASTIDISSQSIFASAEQSDQVLDLKKSEENPSLPPPTTETPVNLEEILPPLDEGLVTPNPIEYSNENVLPSEKTVYQKNDLPSNLLPDFKDPEEVKENESSSGGILSGLGGLLPLFRTEENTVQQIEPTTEQIPEKLDAVEINKSDLSFEDHSEETLPYENLDNSYESSNPLTEEKNENENSNEETLSESEIAGGFLSGITSFFGMGSENVEDQLAGESNDQINEDIPASILKHSEIDKLAELDTNQNSGSYYHQSSDMRNEQVAEKLEVCDSKSDKCPQIAEQGFCDKEHEDCPQKENLMSQQEEKVLKSLSFAEIQDNIVEAFSSDMFLYLFTTASSVLILIFVWVLLEKCRREGPLIARINKLEQQLLATTKENEMLQEKALMFVEEKTQLVVETVPNEVVDELNEKIAEMVQSKLALEEQIQALEKELDTSTEVGIELNKIISEMLNSGDGSEIVKENIEQMQKRILEQQDSLNILNDNLNLKDTENHELGLELEISNKKVIDLQTELDKMVEKILRIEEERDQQHITLEKEIAVYKNKCKEAFTQEHVSKSEILALKQKVAELQRTADTKIKEYSTLKETLNTIKSVKNDKEALKSFLDVSEIKAQLEQMKSENLKYSEQIAQEREVNMSYTSQIQSLSLELNELRMKYEKADKDKVEINTKLEVLNNYFKEKEDQMQKEISKYESLWVAKEGEATSTTERIRYMQEELQNYKAQNESLKQEIVNQEVELKSQISVLEKKSHESWVTNRQTERKLEEARQEAALLRNRLTMRERALAEGNNQMRMQSPLHQNGELPISPPPLDPTQSPPPLYNTRDHMTKSPPIPGLPPPFLPPPMGGAPFMPPPPLDGMMPPPLGDMGGMPPFIPGLHPGMFPGDRRPPPLGRMSSPPPVGGRYTPESTVYSEYDRYDRRSPSPPYDSEYGASPPPIRGYSPYNDIDRDRLRDDRREYKRPQPRSNGRNSKGVHSSGSENDSLGNVNKKPHRKI